MKSYFFRLSKNWLFWALIVIQVFVIVSYSIYYALNVWNSNERWEHSIVKYDNASDLEAQKIDLQNEIEALNIKSDKKSYDRDEKQFITESIEIIEFLKENNYSYDEVTEAIMMYHMENDKRAYFTQNIEMFWFLNLFVSIAILGLIVNYTKISGSRTFDILLHGRKNLFFRDFKVYMTLMGMYISLQFIIVAIISSQFSSKSQFFLYYNNGDIKVLSLTNILIWATISFFLYFGVTCILHFCLSQLIDNIFCFGIITVVVTVAIHYFLFYYSDYKFISALLTYMNYIYENNISVGYYLLALLFKYAIVSALFVATYFINKKRRLRINVN